MWRDVLAEVGVGRAAVSGRATWGKQRTIVRESRGYLGLALYAHLLYTLLQDFTSSPILLPKCPLVARPRSIASLVTATCEDIAVLVNKNLASDLASIRLFLTIRMSLANSYIGHKGW